MNHSAELPGELRLTLLLFSVGGVSFAVDADQIESMRDYGAGDTDDLLWFHDLLGFGDREVCYRTPTVLSLKSADPHRRQVVIDAMEDIAEYGMEVLAPLPALLEPFGAARGIWGVLKRDTGLTILVDLYRSTGLMFDHHLIKECDA